MTGDAIHVVVPVHNSLRWLDGCLRSLHGQTLPPAAITVVDDASRDGSTEHVRTTWPGVAIVRREVAGGYATAVNAGATGTQTMHVLVLNVDTELRPTCLERLSAALRADPALGVAGPRLLNPDGSLQPSCHRLPTLRALAAESLFADRLPVVGARLGYHLFTREGAYRDVTRVGWVTGAALLVRDECWNAIGGFDDRYPFYCEEIDLQERAARAGYHAALVPDAQLVHAGGKAPVPVERFVLAHDGFERYFGDRHGRRAGRQARAWLCVTALSRAVLWTALSRLRRGAAGESAAQWAAMFRGTLRRSAPQLFKRRR